MACLGHSKRCIAGDPFSVFSETLCVIQKHIVQTILASLCIRHLQRISNETSARVCGLYRQTTYVLESSMLLAGNGARRMGSVPGTRLRLEACTDRTSRRPQVLFHRRLVAR